LKQGEWGYTKNQHEFLAALRDVKKNLKVNLFKNFKRCPLTSLKTLYILVDVY